MRKAALALVLLTGAPASADDATTLRAYWGSPSVDGGKCCASLAEVRQNINRIDRELVRLMAERSKYVTEAGRFKPTLAAVIAPARVDLIIPKVRAEAEAQDLDPTVAEATFRAMIAAFEVYEQAEWVKRQGLAPAKP